MSGMYFGFEVRLEDFSINTGAYINSMYTSTFLVHICNKTLPHRSIGWFDLYRKGKDIT